MCEGTPCPITHNVANPLIITPNKPIITRATYHQISTHIICAFNTTLHLVKADDSEIVTKIKIETETNNETILTQDLCAFRNAFQDVKYEWVEKQVKSIKDTNDMFTTNIRSRKTDLLVLRKKYLAIELSSCIIPFSIKAIACYSKIFNFFAVIRNEFLEQEKLQKKIRSFIPSADEDNESLRE
ncbi:hypothetical protein F8M41_004127 [Gigaspora margarita]|uniref:Uncharacterized protein n=1 Tax=Gigaspora margarita TaxID=4874 RepID=A0A8H3XBK0_GIGMA|nr:hypothetical protein F8M41_004127 [Gigaspora margarita]